mgnify:CR=1 FL=1
MIIASENGPIVKFGSNENIDQFIILSNLLLIVVCVEHHTDTFLPSPECSLFYNRVHMGQMQISALSDVFPIQILQGQVPEDALASYEAPALSLLIG